MPIRTFAFRAGQAVLVAAALLMAAPAPASAQSLAVRYERLVQRETAARRAASTSIASLRTLAKAYEAFTRAHPVSGYSDNALWQAAGIYETIYARTHAASDRDQAARLLTWLGREYPTGRLARQVDERLAAFAAKTAAPAAVPPPTPAAPAAVATASNSPAPFPATDEPAADRAEALVRLPAPAVVSTALLPPPVRPAPKPAGALPVTVKALTYASLPKGDRLIVEFSAEASYSSTRSSSPDRVYVELSNASAEAAIAEHAGQISGPLVKGVSVAQAANGAARLVLQLAGEPRYSTFPLYDPFRLVIDVESDAIARARETAPEPAAAHVQRSIAHDAIALASASVPPSAPVETPVRGVAALPPAATKTGDYTLARQLGLGVSRVVIDPGHGGHDPGASANGVTEAGLVLDVALRLETLLTKQGTDVVLTRRTNEYVPLETRTAIANREAADMFISIHANASARKAASGVETFYLDFAANPYAQSVAARENATSTQNMRVLPELVKTIALTNKLQESRELAGAVQSSLVKRLRVKDAGAKDLGVKRAPFVVLIGAEMPSVLAEISFLTNRAEATLLKQASYRQRVAQALADAIVKYQATLKKTSTVAARNTP
jgi:N-acetylmuramoyl-L-alanine amidase